MKIIEVAFVAAYVSSIRATNIMLHKKTIQSPTLNGALAENAVDGDINTASGSMNDETGVAYWQGDLQGFYNVFNITITAYTPWNMYILNAIFGMSLDDVNCPNVQVVQCGQWPSFVPTNPVRTYTCSYNGPIRFMKFTKPDGLGLAEVKVQGEPTTLKVTKYDAFPSQKLSQPSSSMTAESSAHCGMGCHKNQPCIAFSFSRQEQPNCLLATDDVMVTDSNWKSYIVRPCLSTQQCT